MILWKRTPYSIAVVCIPVVAEESGRGLGIERSVGRDPGTGSDRRAACGAEKTLHGDSFPGTR